MKTINETFTDEEFAELLIKKNGTSIIRRSGRGNDGTGNIVERDEWRTNQELFNKLNKQYKFSFDCCASRSNKKCKSWSDNFTFEKSGEVGRLYLKHFTAWMNPPFSKSKEMFKHFVKVVNKGVCIYSCDNMETKVWQEVILLNATWIFIPKGRINYEGMKGKGSRFPSALIGFNVEPPKDINETTLFVKRSKTE